MSSVLIFFCFTSQVCYFIVNNRDVINITVQCTTSDQVNSNRFLSIRNEMRDIFTEMFLHANFRYSP